MKRTSVHHGRPLYSRVERGYGGDLAALARLRAAMLNDGRFTSDQYMVASRHLQALGAMLAPYAKGQKARTRGKPAR